MGGAGKRGIRLVQREVEPLIAASLPTRSEHDQRLPQRVATRIDCAHCCRSCVRAVMRMTAELCGVCRCSFSSTREHRPAERGAAAARA